jgi:hypothetical protein
MCKPLKECVEVKGKDTKEVVPREARATNNPLRCIPGYKQCSDRVCYPSAFFSKPPSENQFANYRDQFKNRRNFNEGQAKKAVAAVTKMQKHAKNIRLAQNMNNTKKKKSLRDKARIELEQINKEKNEKRKEDKTRKRKEKNDKIEATMASSETSSSKRQRQKTKRDQKIARRLARRQGVGAEQQLEQTPTDDEPPDQFEPPADDEPPENGNDGDGQDQFDNGNDGYAPPDPFENQEQPNAGNTELIWNEDYVNGKKQAPSYSQYKGASTIAEFVNKGRKKSSDAAIRADFNYYLNVLKKLSSAEAKPEALSVKDWNNELKERLKSYQNDMQVEAKKAVASSSAPEVRSTRSTALRYRLRSSLRNKK